MEPLRYDDPAPGDRMVTGGAVLFGVGLAAALVTLVPLFVRSDPLPTAVYLTAGLAPVGLALALVGMLRGARSRRERLRG